MGHAKDLLQGIAALLLPFLSIVLLFTLVSNHVQPLLIGQDSEDRLRDYHSVAYADNEVPSYEVYEATTVNDDSQKIALAEPIEPPHDKDCICCC